MNWSLFYALNKQAIDLLLYGLMYGVGLGIVFAFLKAMIENIDREDKLND
jgi:cytochrome c biogenesis protein CcdA